MILSNVNIGTGPSAGDGDPLRTAFNTINQNFAKIESNVNSLTNSVTSVAGRTGNVVLTINDIIGFSTTTYPNATTIGSWITSNVAALVSGAPAVLDTLNELAAAINDDANIAVTITTAITTANTAMKGYVDAELANVNVDLSGYATESYTGNLIASLEANLISNVSTLTSNAAVQAGLIADNSQAISTLTSNAAVQAGLIAGLQSSTYGNANVATYLPSYGGNVKVTNVTFDDLSIQSTAYTGTQWRSNLSSNLTSKPSWLSYVPGLKNQPGVQYGFDATGMFFNGNADNDFAYPVQTYLSFHQEDQIEITTTIFFATTSDDHGIAIFSSTTRPIWRYSTDPTRIAYQFTNGIPLLYGQSSQDLGSSPVLTPGNYYTIKFTYDPTNTVVVELFSGNTATGTALDTRSLSEALPAGDYKIGFDADKDSIGLSHFTNLSIRTLTNTVVNDLEVQGQITGNLIPSANVAYSLGNITHQWKDLWVSSNTIYIGGTALGVSSGNLTINGNIIPTADYVDSAISVVTFDQDLNTTDNVTFANIVTSTGQITVPTDTDFALRLNHSTFGEANVIVNSQGYMEVAGGYVGRSFTQILPGEVGATGYFGFTGNITNISGINGLILDTGLEGSGGTWTLSTDGRLTVPGGGFVQVVNDEYLDIAYIANIRLENEGGVWNFDYNGNLTFPDSTVQTTAWTGTVAYGNTIAIGYQTGNTSQGNNAVAIGSAAGQTSQGGKAIGIGEVAGRLNQGIESIGLGAGAGEQNQGAYAIAIGSTTAYLNQGVGAVAIGTSAGALYQGEHAIAIGTGAGNGLQGNNSIILNATGTTLDQTTDDTFTVKPIRAASAGNVLYYNPSSGEITYSNSVIYNQTLNTTDTVRFYELAVGISGSLETIIYNDAININGSFALTENSIETFSGNVSAGYFFGDGSQLTGIVAESSYGDSNVAAYLPTYTGNITANYANVSSLRVGDSISTIIGNIRIESRAPFYDAVIAYNSPSGNTLIESGNGLSLVAGGNLTIEPGMGRHVVFASGMMPGTVLFDVDVISSRTTPSTSTTTGALTVAGGVGIAGNIYSGRNVSVGGILRVEDGVHEAFQSLADATGVVTHDCANGHIFYHTSPDANWTANFANLNLASGYATTLTLVISQGATGYYANVVQIGGAAQTINWQGNTTPTPSSNRTDVASFSIINNSGTYTVLGQLTGF